MVENPQNHGEIYGPHPLLRDVVRSVAAKNFISNSIDHVELGLFQGEAESLINKTLADPQKREVAKLAYVSDKRVILPAAETQGERDRVRQQYHGEQITNNLFVINGETVKPTVSIHTHGIMDLPPSPADLSSLFLPPSTRQSVPVVFVATATRNMIVFRGENTPSLTPSEVNNNINKWNTLVEERLRKFMDIETSRDEIEDLNNRAQTQLLKQICDKYDLKLFSGPRSSPVVTRQFPPGA